MGPTIEQQIAALKRAQQREREAVKLRNQGKTLKEIGDALGITGERARQLIARAERERTTG